jgi:flagellar biosynthesis/type III secretory pathway chaperone
MDGTDALVEDLAVLLARELACLEAFDRRLDEEWTLLRSGSPDALAVVVSAKLSLLDDLRNLETQRAALLAALGALWGLDPAALSLREIAGRAPAAADRLRRLGGRLRESMAAALRANRRNGAVIQQVRGFLEESLTRWRPAEGPSPIYSGAGLARPAVPGASLLERRG